MTNATYGYRHFKARQFLLRMARLSPVPVICWRCETPIHPSELSTAEAGHVVDAVLADPTQPVRLRLEHRACNRAAGLALGIERTRTPRAPNRSWTTTEL